MAKQRAEKNSSIFSKLTDWHCLGLLTVLVAVFFQKILLGEAYLWEDFIYYYYPTKNFAAVSLATGKLPLWNPYTFSGMPFLADIQNAVFYPFNLLLAVFANETLNPIYVEYSIVLHFLLAGVGMFYLARYLGLERIAALFAATAFVFSGFTVTHAIHQTVISGAAWLPLIALFTIRTLRTKNLWNMLLASLVLALSVLAGFPQVSLYIYFFVGCLFLCELIVQYGASEQKAGDTVRLSGKFLLIVGFSLGMAAMQLLPTMELAPLSNRAAISYEQSLVGSLTWGQLLTLVVPKFFGVSSAEGYNYWGPQAYWHYWETCIYVGLPTLMLALMALRYLKQNPYWTFFVIVVLFSLLAALGDDFILHKLLFHYAPGFDKFRNPGRFTMLFAFAMPLLAGVGLHQLIFDKDFFKDRRKALTPSGAVPFVVALLFLAFHVRILDGSFEFLRTAQVQQFVNAEITTALLFALCPLALVLAVWRGWMSRAFVGGAFVVLAFVDLYVFGFSQNNGRANPSDYFRRAEPIVKTLLAEGKQELFRVNSRQGGHLLFDRNQGMIHPVFLLEGYTPLGLAHVWPPANTVDEQLDMLNVKYAIHIDEQRQSMGLRPRSGYLPRAYVVYGVRESSNQAETQMFLKSADFDYRRSAVVESQRSVNLPAATQQLYTSAAVIGYESDRIVVKADTRQPSLLVLSEVYYPGWVATVDGAEKEILCANSTLRAVALEAGNHTVVFEFKPNSLRTGAWISTISFALCIVIAYFATRFFGRQMTSETT